MNDVVHTETKTPLNTGLPMDKTGGFLSIELSIGGRKPDNRTETGQNFLIHGELA
jgi:hypothetical protein